MKSFLTSSVQCKSDDHRRPCRHVSVFVPNFAKQLQASTNMAALGVHIYESVDEDQIILIPAVLSNIIVNPLTHLEIAKVSAGG